jgi:hypothetical protein
VTPRALLTSAVLCRVVCDQFVPAKNAVIGLVDKILSRITTVDSVQQTLSSFTTDCAQVSFALRQATSRCVRQLCGARSGRELDRLCRSLLLIDEFGKGTTTFDGIALVAGLIRHLDACGPECPKALLGMHGIDIPRSVLSLSHHDKRACAVLSDDAINAQSHIFMVRAQHPRACIQLPARCVVCRAVRLQVGQRHEECDVVPHEHCTTRATRHAQRCCAGH